MLNWFLNLYRSYPWIVWTYLATVVILDLIFLVYYFRNKDYFKEELKEKTWLKVSFYVLIALNLFLIIFFVILWLVSISGGSRKRGRKTFLRRRKYWRKRRY